MSKSIGVFCPLGKITHADCRTCAQDPLHPCQYPPDILESMRRTEDHAAGSDYTATGLLNCDRQDVLINQIEGGYYQDVDGSWPMLRGSMVHALMEKQTYPGAVDVIREERLYASLVTSYGAFIFSGQVDLIVIKRIEDGVAYAKIVDFKSTSEIDHELTAAKDDHQMQINIYKWLVEECMFCHTPTPSHIKVDELEIVYADMKRVRRFTSVDGDRMDRGKLVRSSKRDAEHVYTQHYASGKLHEVLELAPIRFLTNEQIQRWVVRRIEAKERAKRGEMPGLIADDKRWLCFYCPTRSQCEQIERGGQE